MRDDRASVVRDPDSDLIFILYHNGVHTAPEPVDWQLRGPSWLIVPILEWGNRSIASNNIRSGNHCGHPHRGYRTS